MSVFVLPAAEVLSRFDRFDAVIDARSEGEYAEDRLPGALNWPSLNDAERARVGTLYKQVSPFEAQKVGAALVARNIASHIEREVMALPRSWQPLVYCWRGGKRSNSLALVLGQIGFRVHVLEGGYKAFRSALLADMPSQVQRLHWRVVCGPTGSGKTRLLHALARAGAQVLDLEELAQHRASVLGLIPGQPQPGQKQFETRIWDRLRRFDARRPVYVEAESRKVGNRAVPEALIAAMRAAPCLRIDLDDDERVRLLLEDYAFFSEDPEFFCQRLDALAALRGRQQVAQWQALVRGGDVETVVRELLVRHYDPGYAESTRRNFVQFAQATPVRPADRTAAAFDVLARAQVAQDAPTPA